MRADLGWSFAQAGAMNTANAAGYLVGALVAAALGARMGDKAVFAVGLVLTALAVGVIGSYGWFHPAYGFARRCGFHGRARLCVRSGAHVGRRRGKSKSRAPTLLGIYFAGAAPA